MRTIKKYPALHDFMQYIAALPAETEDVWEGALIVTLERDRHVKNLKDYAVKAVEKSGKPSGFTLHVDGRQAILIPTAEVRRAIVEKNLCINRCVSYNGHQISTARLVYNGAIEEILTERYHVRDPLKHIFGS